MPTNSTTTAKRRMPARTSMSLQFTYLIDATLNLPMHKENGDAKHDGAECPDKPKRWFVSVGVEISQPTTVISVTTIIPSQNLRYTSCSLRRSSSDIAAYSNVGSSVALTAPSNAPVLPRGARSGAASLTRRSTTGC